jgi:transcriptional regulator GlxA family with amidase domain
MRASTSRRIVFTVYDGVSLLDLSGPLEAFRVAADLALEERRTSYECIVMSARGGRIMTGNGVELNTRSARSVSGKTIDTLVVPGALRVEPVTRDRALIQRAHPLAGGSARCALAVSCWLPQESSMDAERPRTGSVAQESRIPKSGCN